jgi:nitroreductase
MKKIIIGMIVFAAGFLSVNAADIDVLLKHFATRDFIAGTISNDDLTTILTAGARAPSAVNRQPWHFTVVQNQDLVKRIVPGSVNGNILIVISTSGDGRTNGSQILDCALATQSIYLAAQALGLGSRIYTGPIAMLNQQLKSELGLPPGYSAVSLVRVGRVSTASTVDSVTGASSRKSLSAQVNYR